MKSFVLTFSFFYLSFCLCSCFFKSLSSYVIEFNETGQNEMKNTEMSPPAELNSASKQPMPLADSSALNLRQLKL